VKDNGPGAGVGDAVGDGDVVGVGDGLALAVGEGVGEGLGVGELVGVTDPHFLGRHVVGLAADATCASIVTPTEIAVTTSASTNRRERRSKRIPRASPRRTLRCGGRDPRSDEIERWTAHRSYGDRPPVSPS
jgi:hypothetical protein